MWKFSAHALTRMKERGYTVEDVIQVLDSKVPVSIKFKSPIDPDVEICMGYAGKKHMLIPVNIKTKNVITIRPMRREERREFDKRVNQ